MPFLKKIETKIDVISNTNSESDLDPEKFFKKGINWLLQKAILCGEYYDSIAVNNLRKKIYDLDLDLASRKKADSESCPVADLMKAVNFAKSRFLFVFYELSDLVNNNLGEFLNGRPAAHINLVRFKNYDLKRELDDLLKIHVYDSLKDDAIFRINILLAYLDEYPACDANTLEELTQIDLFLKVEKTERDNEEVVQILWHKVDYLKFKINYRYRHPQENIDESLQTYPKIANDNNCYKAFYYKTLMHYAQIVSKDASQWETILKESLNLPFVNLKLEPFHHLRKYMYSRNANNLDKSKETCKRYLQYIDNQLKKIETSQTETNENRLSLFEQVSYYSTKKLISNSIFGLEFRIERENKFDTIKTDIANYISGISPTIVPENEFLSLHYSKILEFSSRYKIPDYYCFILFVDFLSETIKCLKSEASLIIELSKRDRDDPSLKIKKQRIFTVIANLESAYDKALKELKNNLELMLSYKALPIYLTWKECQISYQWSNPEDEGEKLFLRSSYILPVDYQKTFSKLASWDNMAHVQQSALKDTYDVAIANYDILSKITDFDKKVKENEFKIVQIVAMFVSIAAFVLTSVKIFENKNGLESFGIIIGLAGCFFLFNLFFYIIVISQYKTFKEVKTTIARFLAFIICPVALCVGSFLILKGEHVETTNRNLERFKADSCIKAEKINHLENKLQMDSLLIYQLHDDIKILKSK